MYKTEYLRKVFAHTKGKTFENYVINQIWAKVEDLGLYPVTQQYVKRPEGYALIDLYFPQIKFAIEIDETSHEGEIYKNSDIKRMEDIFSALPNISSERIKEGDYEFVKQQISNVVEKIEEKVKEADKFEKWEENWQEKEYEKNILKIKESKKLKISDSIGFKKIQVTNDIFNMNISAGYLQHGKSSFKIANNKNIWFPHLTKNKSWENTINEDWSIINEKYKGEDKKKYEYNPKLHDKNIEIYTFAKYRNNLGEISYRFIGIFIFKEKGQNAFVYEKISDEIDFQEFFKD
jgi:hypothetical protein